MSIILSSIQQLQTVLGVTVDGNFGPASYAALSRALGTSQTKLIQIQGILGVSPDGVWGAKSITALQSLIWPYEVTTDGADLIATGIATCWGGPTDPDDDGTTACGFSTKNNPDFKGVSIAMAATSVRALMGSPIPHMPFGIIHRGGAWVDNPEGARVIVTVNTVDHGPWPVIDEGPGFNPPDFKRRVVDITTIAALDIEPSATANNFEVPCSIRIIGAAPY